MRNVTLTMVAGFALMGGTALAADAAFENHLTSTPMVSPAQIYQVQDLRTDFAVGFTSAKDEAKQDTGDKETNTASGTSLFAAGIYNVQAIGLRAGLAADYGAINSESKDARGKFKTEGKEAVITPQVAYQAGPVVVGAALDVVQRTVKPEETITLQSGEEISELQANFTTFRPGVMFADKGLEAGLAFSTRRKSAGDFAKEELAIDEPSKVTLHGRYALNSNLAVGGIVGTNNYQGLDKDAYKAQTTVKGTGEFGAGALKVEGDIGYNSAYAKNDDTLNENTMGTYEIGAATDYAVTSKAAVGGGVNYEFGSASANDKDYAANELSVLVRGDMRF